MRIIETRTGARLPAIGQGTWHMGEHRASRREEVAALRLGFDLGLTLVDTAESYANGGAEEVVGEAIRDRRDEIFVVSKVSPRNASRRGTVEAAERSLRRLGTDRIDLYLLHWPGPRSVEETLAAFHELAGSGKILHYGLSNFDYGGLREAVGMEGGDRIAADQVLYNLENRGIEHHLLPWCAEHGVAIMAYSPLDQGKLPAPAALDEVAARHDSTPEEIALAWSIHRDGVCAVVKASSQDHVRANARAAEIHLTREDLNTLNGAFPAPERDVPIDSR